MKPFRFVAICAASGCLVLASFIAVSKQHQASQSEAMEMIKKENQNHTEYSQQKLTEALEIGIAEYNQGLFSASLITFTRILNSNPVSIIALRGFVKSCRTAPTVCDQIAEFKPLGGVCI